MAVRRGPAIEGLLQRACYGPAKSALKTLSFRIIRCNGPATGPPSPKRPPPPPMPPSGRLRRVPRCRGPPAPGSRASAGPSVARLGSRTGRQARARGGARWRRRQGWAGDLPEPAGLLRLPLREGTGRRAARGALPALHLHTCKSSQCTHARHRNAHMQGIAMH